jgi:Tfp pilus assembly protein FimV
MNGAIVNLAEEHRAQMEEMKQQCEQQIQQVRAECAAGASREASFAASLQANYIHGVQAAAPIQYVSQEALARLMDQGKFHETIQQLTEAVGQKESLEQKLLRIKEKIQKAKEIKQHSIQTSPPSAGSSLVYSGCINPNAIN